MAEDQNTKAPKELKGLVDEVDRILSGVSTAQGDGSTHAADAASPRPPRTRSGEGSGWQPHRTRFCCRTEGQPMTQTAQTTSPITFEKIVDWFGEGLVNMIEKFGEERPQVGRTPKEFLAQVEEAADVFRLCRHEEMADAVERAHRHLTGALNTEDPARRTRRLRAASKQLSMADWT